MKIMKPLRYTFVLLFALVSYAQVFPPVGGGGSGGATIPSTTNLIRGDGAGTGANSGISSAQVQTIYNVLGYGVVAGDIDTAGANSTAMLSLLSTVNTAGGGTICFPPAATAYRFDSQLLLPNDGGSPQPTQKNIVLATCGGSGGAWYGVNAAVLDLRYHGTAGNAKIETRGTGTLVIQDLTLEDLSSADSYSVTGGTLTSIVVSSNVATVTFPTLPGGAYYGSMWAVSGSTTSALNGVWKVTAASSPTMTMATISVPDGTYNNGPLTVRYSTPFIHSTNTTLLVSRNTFIGNGVYTGNPTTGTRSGQDAIVLGGTNTAANASVDGAFQGYVTRIYDNHFRALNRGLFGLNYANEVKFAHNSFQGNVGAWAVEFDGTNGGGQVDYGNSILDNTVEMDIYTYFLKGTLFKENLISGNGMNDPQASVVAYHNFTNLSTQNKIICGTSPVSKTFINGDAASLAATTILCSESGMQDSTGNGAVSTELAYNATVKGTYDGTKVYTGALNVTAKDSPTQVVSIGFDSANTQGIIVSKINATKEPLKIDGSILVLPTIASATSTVSGALLYDTTNKNLHAGANSVDNIIPLVPSGVIPINGNCPKWVVTAGVVTLSPSDACAGGGTVNSGTAGHLSYYATSTAAVSDMGADFTFSTHTLSMGASGLLDMSAGAVNSVTVPKVAGASTSTVGTLAYDTTNKNWHFGSNAVDNLVALTPSASIPTDGDCAKFSVTANVLTIIDAGGPCTTGVNPANYQTSSAFTGIGGTAFTPTHTLDVYGTTATTLLVKTGTSQSIADLADFQFTNATANDKVAINSSGTLSGQTNAGGTLYQIVANAGGVASFRLHSLGFLGWNSTSNLSGGALDTSLWRSAANELSFAVGGASGSGGSWKATNGTLAGKLVAQSVQDGGTTFTASGCSNSTLVGGATTGSFNSGTTGACTVTITMGNTQTAAHGWACSASDQTTPANLISQSGGSATTAILTGTTVSGDVISFSCKGY